MGRAADVRSGWGWSKARDLHPRALSEASLFEESPLPPSEARVLNVLRQDEALQMDEILEKLEPEMSSSEVFTALFELELAGAYDNFLERITSGASEGRGASGCMSGARCTAGL